ncbi:hypothetical protein BCR44DRAFT_1462314 [Catenaria anguillulae PL171]|uniref:Uncharacterized protein n=1 Tax=Catenaria anguillulae PL171 TaxID=765915 RepID=A0A1Y2HIQ5_9FUNG|nr:hypothetical protein BCR44DRAFT_1462314 [Catenaria anguillulae PL171]
MLSPVIALLPIAHLLLGSLHPSLASAYLPLTTAVDSAFARLLIRAVIQYTPPVLAIVEGLATVFIVKLIGRIMQISVDENDRVRTSSRSAAGRSGSHARSSSAVAGRGGLQPRMRGASLAHSAAAIKGGKASSAANGALSVGAAQVAVAEVAKDASQAISTSMHRVSKRPKVAIPLLAGTALALYQFYSLYTLLSDPHLRLVVLVVFGLCVAAVLAMAFLLQPGENDAPGAEALFLHINNLALVPKQ